MSDVKATLPGLMEKKRKKEKIVMLTAYDMPLARLLDEAGIDLVLVGDSLGMVALGYATTVPVTMEEMLHHAKAVRKGVSKALVVGDMPFMSFNLSRQETIRNAGRFLKEAGCDAVKMEWGQGLMDSVESVHAVVEAGIPVLGHVGLTPQTAGKLGGFRVQGKKAEDAAALFQAAIQLEKAGCFAVVLECVPSQVGRLITQKLFIPTIGIGAGPDCDGQVLVTHDLLGLSGSFHPKFARRFTQLDQEIMRAVQTFRSVVEDGTFPSKEESYPMPESELKRLKGMVKEGVKNRRMRKNG